MSERITVPCDDDSMSWWICDGGVECNGHSIVEVVAAALSEEMVMQWVVSRKRTVIKDWFDEDPVP